MVELQGSNSTRTSASWLVQLVAGTVGWAVTQSV